MKDWSTHGVTFSSLGMARSQSSGAGLQAAEAPPTGTAMCHAGPVMNETAERRYDS